MRYSIENSVENYLDTQYNEIKIYKELDNCVDIIHEQILLFYGADIDELMGEQNQFSRYQILGELQIRKPFLASSAITDWMTHILYTNPLLREAEIERFRDFLEEQDSIY